MDDNSVENRQGQLYLLGARGYSAYEVAVQNGFVGTEEEWLASLKGDKGDTGDTFDELTPEQKAEIKGDTGKSAYEIAVEHGFIGTEQDWVNAYLSPEGYIRKVDVVDNLTSTETQKPLSAKQGKILKDITDDLQEDIDDLNDKVTFLFPKFMPNVFSGDSNLIKYGDINILIDCDSTTKWTYVKQFLDDNDATHIDYLIISHYHGDHYGNYQNLINNGYIDSDTQVFLPIVPSQFTAFATAETNVKNALTTANIPFRTPEEKEQITIGKDLKVTFGNLDKTYMEANYTQENAASMVCLIEHKNVSAFYAGDAYFQTYKYLYGINFINKTIDLYKQAHHGIDATMPFILLDSIMSPRHTVQLGGIKDFAKNNFYCEETSFLINQGTLYYPCYMQTEYIEFESNGKVLNCLSGRTSSYSGMQGLTNLYVDINASLNEIQNGTEEHPFSELMQAIGYLKSFPSGNYTIHVADGNYGYSHEATGNEKNSIQIHPNTNQQIIIYGNSEDRTAVMLNGLRCYDANVRLYNLTLDSKLRDGIQMTNTSLLADNILITSSDTTVSSHTGILCQYGSTLRLINSKIEYCSKGVRVTTGSYYTYANNEFDYIALKKVEVDGAHVHDTGLVAGTEGSTVLLSDNYKNYDWIEITYRTNDYLRNSVKVYNVDDDWKVVADVAYTNNNGSTYDKKALFEFKDGNKIRIINMYQTSIVNGQLSVTALSDGAFVINNVFGGYHG